MTEPRQIAVVRSYDELHAALRGRADELAVTRETIDAVSGLQAGYSAKLLAPVPIRGIGRESMGPLLGTLGLMLVVVEDVVALAKVQGRLTKSRAMPNGVQHPLIIIKFSRRHMQKLGKKSAAGRMKKLPKWKRSAVARKAAKARWRKPKVVEAEGRGSKNKPRGEVRWLKKIIAWERLWPKRPSSRPLMIASTACCMSSPGWGTSS